MSLEISREIKAWLLIAMLFVAEAHDVQQKRPFSRPGSQSGKFSNAAAKEAVPAEFGLQSGKFSNAAARAAVPAEQAKYVSRQMELLLTDPNSRALEQFEAMAADPSFQKQADRLTKNMELFGADPRMQEHFKRVDEHLRAMMGDSKLQDQMKLAAEQMNAIDADSKLQTRIKRILEQVAATMSDKILQEKSKRLTEQLLTMMADPALKKQSRLVARSMGTLMAHPNSVDHMHLAEQMKALKTHPKLREQAELMAEQILEMRADPKFKEHIELVVTEIEALFNDPNMQQMATRLTKQMEAMATDAKLQEHAKLAAEQMEAMMAEPKLQEQAKIFTKQMEAMMNTAKSQKQTQFVADEIGAMRPPVRNVVDGLADNLANKLLEKAFKMEAVALVAPSTFTWIPESAFTVLLGILMHSVGHTTSLEDFKNSMSSGWAVALNFIACFGIMPALAYFLAKAIGADGPILSGLVLVGAVSGGQSSNLCTLIAEGDVALSVLMTTSTTVGVILMTPLICKFFLGTVVPVNAWGIVESTCSVILIPIALGVLINTKLPAVAEAITPITPIFGVCAITLLVGASVAKCASTILEAGLPLQVVCLSLHLVGGILGYLSAAACKFDKKVCRTVAIETAMKNSALGFLLASQHFGAFNVRVPSAVSIVWMAVTGSLMAVFWKVKGYPEIEAPKGKEDDDGGSNRTTG